MFALLETNCNSGPDLDFPTSCLSTPLLFINETDAVEKKYCWQGISCMYQGSSKALEPFCMASTAGVTYRLPFSILYSLRSLLFALCSSLFLTEIMSTLVAQAIRGLGDEVYEGLFCITLFRWWFLA